MDGARVEESGASVSAAWLEFDSVRCITGGSICARSEGGIHASACALNRARREDEDEDEDHEDELEAADETGRLGSIATEGGAEEAPAASDGEAFTSDHADPTSNAGLI